MKVISLNISRKITSYGYIFRKKLREWGDATGLSQNEFAKLIEVHHSFIDKYKRDEIKPTIDVVEKIADALKTTIGYLSGEAKNTSVLEV